MHFMAKIGESTLDPVIAPRGIFTSHPQNQFNNLLGQRRTPDFLALLAVIPLPGDEFSMPTKKSVWGHNRGDFLERLAAQYLSFDGQAAPLIITEQDAFLAELLFQYLVLNPQVLDNTLLIAVDPARDDEEEEVPWLKDGFHISPNAA